MQLLKNKKSFLFGLLAAGSLLFGACNHEFEDIGPQPTVPGPATGATIGSIVNSDTSYSFFKVLVNKAGAAGPQLTNANLGLTAYIPNNAAFRASGFPSAAAVGGFFDTAKAIAITNYVTAPQVLTFANIPSTFPNFQSPTFFNPTKGTTGFNPLIGLSIFPSKRGTAAWVNNVPLVGTVNAANGVIQSPAFLVAPPSTTLWARIATDPDMSYFKAAVNRGDSGQAAGAKIESLLNLPIGPNFTVFVPTNAAFIQLLSAQITGALMAQGMPLETAQATAAALASSPDVFSNPALFSAISAQTVKGLVVYHILGVRAFSVNFPTTTTNVPTLLNSAIPTHPGVGLTATFAGPFVSSATVKGAANVSASNILINFTPEPNGTSDQHYLNGVLHKIDQVLRPQ